DVKFWSNTGDQQLQINETEHVLHLGGRIPNVQNLHLHHLGVQTHVDDFIIVDEANKTDADSIYAADDVIGIPRLASASFTQGRLAACNMFNIPSLEMPEQIPYGIYTIPEISNIGMTEQEAERMDLDITVGRAFFSEITKADMTNHGDGLLKLIFHTESLKLLGVHILGDEAANLIHLGQSVIALDGDVRYFIQHVMNYPTLSEAYRIAAFNGVNRIYQKGAEYKHILGDRGIED